MFEGKHFKVAHLQEQVFTRMRCVRFSGYIPANAKDLFNQELTLEQAKVRGSFFELVACLLEANELPSCVLFNYQRLLWHRKASCSAADECEGFSFQATCNTRCLPKLHAGEPQRANVGRRKAGRAQDGATWQMLWRSLEQCRVIVVIHFRKPSGISKHSASDFESALASHRRLF